MLVIMMFLLEPFKVIDNASHGYPFNATKKLFFCFFFIRYRGGDGEASGVYTGVLALTNTANELVMLSLFLNHPHLHL